MYLFKIKADKREIEIPVIRSIIGIAFIIALLYTNGHYPYMGYTIALVLLLLFFITSILLLRFKLNSLVVAGTSSILLFSATHVTLFSVLLFVIAVAIKAAYTQPQVDFNNEGVKIKKTFYGKLYSWQELSNVILKDNLLTLDFKNNKVLQLELDKTASPNEKQFNDFCSGKLAIPNRDANQTDLSG
jgi:hypothetical protein